MKLLHEEEALVMNSYSIYYTIGNNTFTHYLQTISCQISILVYILSFFYLKFKYKIGMNFLLSYHSVFLLLYWLFLFNNCILSLIHHSFFNWGLLCSMFFILTQQLFSTIIQFGMYLSNIHFYSKFVFLYSFSFFVSSFPFPIPIDLSFLQIGVIMLIGTFMYFQINNYLQQLILYLFENRITNSKEIASNDNLEQLDLINIFNMLRQLIFSQFVIAILMTTLFECLLFIQSEEFQKIITIIIECLQVLFVYWYYYVMMIINCSICKERHPIIINNEGIELNQGNRTTTEEEEENEDEEWGQEPEETQQNKIA